MGQKIDFFYKTMILIFIGTLNGGGGGLGNFGKPFNSITWYTASILWNSNNSLHSITHTGLWIIQLLTPWNISTKNGNNFFLYDKNMRKEFGNGKKTPEALFQNLSRSVKFQKKMNPAFSDFFCCSVVVLHFLAQNEQNMSCTSRDTTKKPRG